MTKIARVLVEEKPVVVLTVDPPVSAPASSPTNPPDGEGVNELLNANVTLVCQPASRASRRFVAVRWYLDGELLRAVTLAPRCTNGTAGKDSAEEVEEETKVLEDCKMDPSKIRLLNVRRLFGGNYSCRGRDDEGGWGAGSDPTELKVLYPPRGARLRHTPAVVRKGEAFQVSAELY